MSCQGFFIAWEPVAGPQVEERMRELAAGGATVIPVAVEQVIAGLLVAAGQVRPESKGAVEPTSAAGPAYHERESPVTIATSMPT